MLNTGKGRSAFFRILPQKTRTNQDFSRVIQSECSLASITTVDPHIFDVRKRLIS